MTNPIKYVLNAKMLTNIAKNANTIRILIYENVFNVIKIHIIN